LSVFAPKVIWRCPLIKTEREYQIALRRLKAEKETVEQQRRGLEREGFSREQIERGMAPLLSFHQQHVEEIEWYEKVKRQDFRTLSSISQIGHLLIALRVASGLSQKDLAKCLDVCEPQVSRDERNEYRGITKERILRILDVFGVRVKTHVELDHPLTRKRILAAASSIKKDAA
jgi:plasmid maintenance system antidote protein VapI